MKKITQIEYVIPVLELKRLLNIAETETVYTINGPGIDEYGDLRIITKTKPQ